MIDLNDILIHEVGLRDGLQMERQVVPLELKIRWANKIVASRVDIIQLGSFVHPDKVPQMADTDRLFERVRSAESKPETTTFSALVLNEKGLERAFAAGVEMVCMGISASDTHSRKNTGMSTEEAANRIIAMAENARSAGSRVQVSVQSAFGCGFEGPVPQERVLSIMRRYLEAGLHHVSLADTAGHAHPLQVASMVSALRELDSTIDVSCHFHNTYGLGIANCVAAINNGVRTFETSFAGLGGCPFTKVAAGNVCTEDFVHFLRRVDSRNDIDLEGLIAVARDVASFFGREMPGLVYKAGPIKPQAHKT